MAKQPTDYQKKKKPEIAIEFPLDEPINAYGEEVSVLKLRKPTGIDLIEIGNPVNFYPYATPVKIEHDMPKVQAMVARLANIPSSSIAASVRMISSAWRGLSALFLFRRRRRSHRNAPSIWRSPSGAIRSSSCSDHLNRCSLFTR
jgi:hypothetical protein